MSSMGRTARGPRSVGGTKASSKLSRPEKDRKQPRYSFPGPPRPGELCFRNEKLMRLTSTISSIPFETDKTSSVWWGQRESAGSVSEPPLSASLFQIRDHGVQYQSIFLAAFSRQTKSGRNRTSRPSTKIWPRPLGRASRFVKPRGSA